MRLLALIWFTVFLCVTEAKKTTSSSQLAKRTTLKVQLPTAEGVQELQLSIPTRPAKGSITTDKVFERAKAAWSALVETNPAGLQDPKHHSLAPLSPEEAWHHWSAGQEGVVDSGRFLLAFGSFMSVQHGGSEVHNAAALGQLDRVKQLLEDPEAMLDVDERKSLDDSTPLHSAIATGQTLVVRYLVNSAGADVEATGKNQVSPLQLAATLGHVDIAKVLVEGGADVNRAHPFGKTTALHFAAEMGRVEIIEFLCAHGADGNARKSNGGTPLHVAADTNQPSAARSLVKACKSQVNILLAGDTTPLYLAAQRGLTEMCRVLLDELGADPNFEMPVGGNVGSHLQVVDDSADSELDIRKKHAAFYDAKNTEIGNGATALHAAAENGHFETVKLLLQRRARSSASMSGATPLVIALQYHHPDIALHILRNDPQPLVNAKVPIDGSFALLVATNLVNQGKGYDTVLRELIETRPELDVNQENGKGLTALSHAVSLRDTQTSLLLLHAGARVFASKPSTIKVLAQVGLPKDHQSAVKLFDALKRAVKAEGQDKLLSVDEDSKAIHSAANEGHAQLLSNLLKEFPILSPDLPIESTGATSLMIAAREGHHDCVKILLETGLVDVNRRAFLDPLFGATALYLASQNNHVDVIHLLLEAGASPDLALQGYQATPLFVAAERGHLKAVKALVEVGGANKEAPNSMGLTPFVIACLSNRQKTCAYLRRVSNLDIRLQVQLSESHSEELPLMRYILHHGKQVKLSIVHYLMEQTPQRWQAEEDFHLELIELLRIQTSARRARRPKEASQLLQLLLNDGVVAKHFQPPPVSVFIIANAARVDDDSSAPGLSHAAFLLQALFDTYAWKASLPIKVKMDMLVYRGEETGFLSALQVLVRNANFDAAQILLAHGQTLSMSLPQKLILGQDSENESALSLAQKDRAFPFLKLFSRYISAEQCQV